MKLKYGIQNVNIDITSICFEKLYSNGIITIPAKNEICDTIFGDPIYGIKKKIFKTDDDDNILEEFNDLYPIIIYVKEYDDNLTHDGLEMIKNSIPTNLEQLNTKQLNNVPLNTEKMIHEIYNKITINYGTMSKEKKFHDICIRYLVGNEKILEIGGNIGRTSLFIASILNNYNMNNDLNLVTMECNLNMANKLQENRNNNHFNFCIEKSALSNKKLIQKGANETIVSDEIKKGYEFVNIISYEELKRKYNIIFDTLIIDCDGSFYNILCDIPEMLTEIKLIIMKNDYDVLDKKKYINNLLIQHNFENNYIQGGGWGACCNNFYEVWKKNN
jgi:FkbM family methyltransferase